MRRREKRGHPTNTYELLTHINDGHKGLSDVVTRDGLHKGLAVVDEGEEGKSAGGLGDPVQEAVLGAENSGGSHNDLHKKQTRQV